MLVQIETLPAAHNCATTKLREGKMATQDWCADRLGDWVKKNPTKGVKDAKEKLEGDYGIVLKYSKAWSGLKSRFKRVFVALKLCVDELPVMLVNSL